MPDLRGKSTARSTEFNLFGTINDYGGLGLLVVDAKNAFNEINRVRMMWMVRHLWTPVTRFVFNCYYFAEQEWDVQFLHSKEGVTQGDPLVMIAYGIGILPLINNLKREIPDVPQPWYTDYSGALGTFTIIETYFNSLTCQVTGRRYYPEPPKSILIVHPENLEPGKEFGSGH